MVLAAAPAPPVAKVVAVAEFARCATPLRKYPPESYTQAYRSSDQLKAKTVRPALPNGPNVFFMSARVGLCGVSVGRQAVPL